MIKQITTPRCWRQQRDMTMAGIARMLGIGGKNPARTWQRYETGQARPPLPLVARLETISKGKVGTAAWLQVRQDYLARQSKEIAP